MYTSKNLLHVCILPAIAHILFVLNKKVSSFEEVLLYIDPKFDEFIDFIGPAHKDLIFIFLNKALSLDNNTLIKSLLRIDGHVSVTFTNYKKELEHEMHKIEAELLEKTRETCEITGAEGVRMTNGVHSRILDPRIAPQNYNIVINETSNHLIKIIDNLLRENRIFKANQK